MRLLVLSSLLDATASVAATLDALEAVDSIGNGGYKAATAAVTRR